MKIVGILLALLLRTSLAKSSKEISINNTLTSTKSVRPEFDLDGIISNLQDLKKNDSYCQDIPKDSSKESFCSFVKSCQKNFNSSEACVVFYGSHSVSHDDDTSTRNRPSSSASWGYGILCVTAISLTSVVGVSFVPLMSKSFYHNLLSSLIGLAVGSLSGSAMFHLIPSAFSLSEVSFYTHHSYLRISVVIWSGVYLFFIIERFLKVFMEFKSRMDGVEVGHSHGEKVFEAVTVSSSSAMMNGSQSRSAMTEDDELGTPLTQRSPEGAPGCIGTSIQSKELYEQSKQAMRASFGHMERPDTHESRPTVEQVLQLESQNKGSKVATVAWMIIFGDGVHNFIDGLSIGAAFSESILTGISVSVAVFCEEFPHELGDFAVLLNAGMTVRQAMVYNFLSACTCYLGLFLGIMLGELDMGNQYIFAAAGGMFLYIALVDMVPELNATMDQQSKVSVKKALMVFFLQNIGICVGIASLFILAKFQDDIHIEI